MTMITVAMFLASAVTGCRNDERASKATPTTVAAAPPAPRIVFVGTSLTAGLGVGEELAFPARLAERLRAAGFDHRVVNAGVSGETSAGALGRIDWVLADPPAVLVIETGANDGLRGHDLEELEVNLEALIDRAKAASPAPTVILVGVRTIANYGAEYQAAFAALFRHVAQRNDVPFVAGLLDGVAGQTELNQADGIHPNRAGHERLAANVWPELERALRERASGRTPGFSRPAASE